MKRALFLITTAAVIAGCMTTGVEPDPSILRVGVTPRSQPMIFKQSGEIAGVEADLARKLGAALNRKTVFVEVPWDKQIEFLEKNRTDIIMSNMTITGPRSVRVSFTTPYMQSGLTGLFRRNNYDPTGLVATTIRLQNQRIGFVNNTTGEFFCRQRFIRATLTGYPNTEAAVTALMNSRIDMFVHDAPMVWWLSSVNERDLVAFPDILNIEPLAWGVARNNSTLVNEVNAVLAQWRRDGTTTRVIQKWIPSFQQ